MAGLMDVILAAIVIVATYFAWIYVKNRRFWKLFGKIPGKPTLPFIGNAYQVGSNTEDFFNSLMEMCELFGHSTYRLVLGVTPIVMLSEPENVEVILSSNKEIDKMNDYKFLSDWLGDGLLLATGNKWRRQRKIMTPTFHFKILEQFVDVFNAKADIFMKILKDYRGKTFDISSLVTLYALDVICETAMGVNVNAQENSESEYIRAVYRVCELIQYRTFNPSKRIDFLYSFTKDSKEKSERVAILHKMTNNVIKARKETLKDEIDKVMKGESQALDLEEQLIGKKKKMAFLDLLLLSKTSDGKPLSDESIREETDTFMFEGHDTTSSAITFAIYELANNPEVQEKALDEQRKMFGDDLSQQPSYNDLQEMKYLEMVIKEVLRLYPSVPIFGRKIQDDLQLPDGTLIPGGCEVLILTFCLGRNPKVYANPLIFDPDRFSIENMRGKHPYMFVPFSAGPRNCIGQKFAMLEIKSVLSKILRNYQLHPSGTDEKLRLVAEIILKSKNGVKIKISDRIKI